MYFCCSIYSLNSFSPAVGAGAGAGASTSMVVGAEDFDFLTSFCTLKFSLYSQYSYEYYSRTYVCMYVCSLLIFVISFCCCSIL